jgi:hypothetical protein
MVLMNFCAADGGEGKEGSKQPSAVLRLCTIIINEMQVGCPVRFAVPGDTLVDGTEIDAAAKVLADGYPAIVACRDEKRPFACPSPQENGPRENGIFRKLGSYLFDLFVSTEPFVD